MRFFPDNTGIFPAHSSITGSPRNNSSRNFTRLRIEKVRQRVISRIRARGDRPPRRERERTSEEEEESWKERRVNTRGEIYVLPRFRRADVRFNTRLKQELSYTLIVISRNFVE